MDILGPRGEAWTESGVISRGQCDFKSFGVAPSRLPQRSTLSTRRFVVINVMAKIALGPFWSQIRSKE